MGHELRNCSFCGARFYPRSPRQRFCRVECRLAGRSLIDRAPYGTEHQRLRGMWSRRLRAGETVAYARCGGLVTSADAWDLDHRDDGVGYLGPSHAECNRATAKPGVSAARVSREW
jgi:hypothetical protein